MKMSLYLPSIFLFLFKGSTNYMIHMSGMYALNKLRETFGVPKISDMIFDTSDYLIYHLKILFRKVNSRELKMSSK